jgi:hypothetical protein
MITAASSAAGYHPEYDACVYEKYRGADANLIFLSYRTIDTVRSQGHNRNACVSSQMFYRIPSPYVLTVWESNRSGRSHIYSRVIQIRIDDVGGSAGQPGEFALLQNYPNPFNPTTTIAYRLGLPAVVRLAIFDLLGREVGLLVNGRQEAGPWEVMFDGRHLSSGGYCCRLEAEGRVFVRRKLLLK